MRKVVGMNHLNKIWVLAMFPIYFGLDGLYKTNDITKSGFIMPVSFYIGILLFMIFFYRSVYTGRITYPIFVNRIILYYFFASLLALFGVVLSTNIVPIVMYAQFAAGTIGIFLAFWMFSYKKMDFELITGLISKFYIILLLLNVLRAVTTTGFAHFTNRFSEVPGTYWWSIYHSFVYYPYIVSMVFLFAIPYWRKRLNSILFFLLYFMVFGYLWVFQVRGAILSFSVGMLVYILLYVKLRKIVFGIVTMILISPIILLNLPTDMLVGRFDDNGNLLKSLGGRDYIYSSFLNNIFSDNFYLFIGSLFRGRQIGALNTNFQGGSIGGSYHNQYLEFVEYGGVLLLLGFFWCIFPLIKLVMKYALNPKNYLQKNVLFWFIITLIQLVFDMNINVPLRVTNPAIMYWFYWTGLGICVTYLYNDNKQRQYDNMLLD